MNWAIVGTCSAVVATMLIPAIIGIAKVWNKQQLMSLTQDNQSKDILDLKLNQDKFSTKQDKMEKMMLVGFTAITTKLGIEPPKIDE